MSMKIESSVLSWDRSQCVRVRSHPQHTHRTRHCANHTGPRRTFHGLLRTVVGTATHALSARGGMPVIYSATKPDLRVTRYPWPAPSSAHQGARESYSTTVAWSSAL